VNTDRRGSVAAGDRSSIKRNVRVQSSALVAALLVGVAGAGLVAVLYVNGLRRLVVRAPAFLPLEDGVGEFALAVVVAEAEGLVDVLAWGVALVWPWCLRSWCQDQPTLSVAGSGVLLRTVLDFKVDGRLTGSWLGSGVAGQQKDAGQRVLDRKHDGIKI
jgi:hypothetical protein